MEETQEKGGGEQKRMRGSRVVRREGLPADQKAARMARDGNTRQKKGAIHGSTEGGRTERGREREREGEGVCV
eukprot:1702917-Prymnesium_polylepis.2